MAFQVVPGPIKPEHCLSEGFFQGIPHDSFENGSDILVAPPRGRGRPKLVELLLNIVGGPLEGTPQNAIFKLAIAFWGPLGRAPLNVNVFGFTSGCTRS